MPLLARKRTHLQMELLSSHVAHEERECLAPHGVLAVGAGLGIEAELELTPLQLAARCHRRELYLGLPKISPDMPQPG